MVRASRLCVAASRSPHAPLIAPTMTSPRRRSAIGRYDGDAALRAATAAPPMLAAPDMVARTAPYTPVLIVSCTSCTGLAGGPVSVKARRARARGGSRIPAAPPPSAWPPSRAASLRSLVSAGIRLLSRCPRPARWGAAPVDSPGPLRGRELSWYERPPEKGKVGGSTPPLPTFAGRPWPASPSAVICVYRALGGR